MTSGRDLTFDSLKGRTSDSGFYLFGISSLAHVVSSRTISEQDCSQVCAFIFSTEKNRSACSHHADKRAIVRWMLRLSRAGKT